LDPTDPRGEFGNLSEAEMDEVIVANLHDSWEKNRLVIRYKHNAVRVALLILGATAVVATILAALLS
jgi:hypothetical protein